MEQILLFDSEKKDQTKINFPLISIKFDLVEGNNIFPLKISDQKDQFDLNKIYQEIFEEYQRLERIEKNDLAAGRVCSFHLLFPLNEIKIVGLEYLEIKKKYNRPFYKVLAYHLINKEGIVPTF